MGQVIEATLFVAGIMIGSGGVMMLLWYVLFAPSAPRPAIVGLTPDEFLTRLRAEDPRLAWIAILNPLSDTRRYRFQFMVRATQPSEGDTLYETTVSSVNPWVYATQAERDLARLHDRAQWWNYCTEHCGWCGICVNRRLHEGWIDQPTGVIGKIAFPDRVAIKPFIPPSE